MNRSSIKNSIMNDNHDKGKLGTYVMECVVCTVKPRYTASFRPIPISFSFFYFLPQPPYTANIWHVLKVYRDMKVYRGLTVPCIST